VITTLALDIKDVLSNSLLKGRIDITPVNTFTTISSTLVTQNKQSVILPGLVVINVFIESSESAGVAYLFEVFEERLVPAFGNIEDSDYIPEYTAYDMASRFYSTVPDVPFVAIGDLIKQTGLPQDRLQQNEPLLLRWLAENFNAQSVLQYQGEWSIDLNYSKGDVVFYLNTSYVNRNGYFEPELTTPNLAPDRWQILAERGLTGVGVNGDDTAYNAVSWQNSTLPPTQGRVRDVIETLATQDSLATKADTLSPVLTGVPQAPTPPIANSSTRLATTEFVGSALTPNLQVVGSLILFAGTSAPPYWVMCDGRTLNRITFAALFAVLSTTYNFGSVDISDFRVPDMRGRVAAGLDNVSPVMGAANRLTTLNTIGASGGVESVVLDTAQMPNHSHRMDYITQVVDAGAAINIYSTAPPFSGVALSTSQVPGSEATAHTNTQPYLCLNYIIYTGVL